MMDINEQTDAFVIALDSLTSRFIREFDLNVYTIAGVMEEKKIELLSSSGFEFESDIDLDNTEDE